MFIKIQYLLERYNCESTVVAPISYSTNLPHIAQSKTDAPRRSDQTAS